MVGNIFLTIALLTGVFSVIMYYLTYKGYKNTLSLARISYHATAIMILAASALLLYAILTHQYQYKYVYNYSGSGMSTGLLMATFWAGQEGSFMLWIFLTSVVGLILLEYTSKRGDLEQRVMMIFTLALSFLLLMVSPLLKSPFNFIWMQQDYLDLKNINQAYLNIPALQSFFFTDQETNKSFVQVGKELYAVLMANNISVNDFIVDGKGLNPLLENFWMQIHPPILFVGFAMSLVPFSFAIAALIKNEYRDWVKQSLPWLLVSMCVLGLGIMIGGYWAYSILGWGGYWGWDPVENSSFIPWLIGVAGIHTMLVQKKTQEKGGGSRFVKTNLILSIMTFILVVYSTFLTRSGILGDASVHSFVDPGMAVYLFLVIFLVTFLLIGVGGIIYRWKYLTENFSFEENVLSRELALFTGAVALIASAIIILAGTSAPIFGTSVEIKFYDEMNLPIAVIIGIVNGLSLLLKWKTNDGSSLWKQARFPLISALVLTALMVIIGGLNEIMLIILALSSSFSLFVNGEIAWKIIKGKKIYLGAYVAHTGIALFLVGVVATAGHTQKQKADLVKGEKADVLGYNLTFLGYEPFDNDTKYKFNVKIEKGGSESVIAPIMFVSDFNNSLTREPDILAGFTKDYYIEPLSYEDGSHSHQDGTSVLLKKGEAHNYNGIEIFFNQFSLPKDMSAMTGGGTFKIGISLTAKKDGKEFSLEPYMENAGQGPVYHADEESKLNLKAAIKNMNASQGEVELIFSQLNAEMQSTAAAPKEMLSIEASIKPFISLIWIGVAVLCTGFLIAATRRTKESVV
ncbi:MAG: Cytochrome c-type bioproteinis protein F [Ignavibacteria bacterium]|nr:MAG: Cytochrome c-type bioproteinis protein F [Ignavibacteria bacterium]KAF0161019.1 MAG: Cytochrome c-type bioproteinis protein F [Ignavibacteria bacterium]